ncbi:hypothetical protein CDAR_608811 [Caerostris darwini]|uniref:Uncharacterized protein n=1 Tax=Caerostris darwini TaxID=1538125 RepID=A0AAV4WKI4_9ARAC|nr:hypothetical protein CDAR_608811 [Caerostris darwini]
MNLWFSLYPQEQKENVWIVPNGTFLQFWEDIGRHECHLRSSPNLSFSHRGELVCFAVFQYLYCNFIIFLSLLFKAV